MARKGQVSIQDNVETDEEFENYLNTHFKELICMEVYSEFCGPCLATGNAVRKGKLEIGHDHIAMVRTMSDHIDALSRFKYKSEPVFLFIVEGKLTRAMFGANGIELCRIIQEELELMHHERETGIPRPKQEIHEMLPEEITKLEEDMKMEEENREVEERLRVLTLAARKKRVCERLSRNLQHYNFILFWPHCHNAHYDLYEKWDNCNINVAAKETYLLTEETAKEALYMSDVEMNEACIHSLTSGEVMVVLFKMFDTDGRDFVKLLRYELYEAIPVPKEDVPPEKQLPPIPAYERYASISKTAREVRRDRYNAKLQKLREEQEERDRLAAEQARLAREAEEERLYQEKKKKEEEKMARIAAGLPASPEPEPATDEQPVEGEGGEKVEGEGGEKVEGEGGEKAEGAAEGAADGAAEKAEDAGGAKAEGGAVEKAETEVTDVTETTEGAVVPEDKEKVEEEEQFNSDVEVEGEDYIPPGGLFVPGLYCPPNELAKANGLRLFYPKVVKEVADMESEHLPPHVLVMFPVDKRHDVKDIIVQFPGEILNMGFFVGDDVQTAEHIAYSIKQYDKMSRHRRHKDRLAVMVSRKRSLPLLQLAGLNPCYISSDLASGERDCLTLFPVGYGDDFQDEESIVEEEPQPTEGNEEKNEEDDEED